MSGLRSEKEHLEISMMATTGQNLKIATLDLSEKRQGRVESPFINSNSIVANFSKKIQKRIEIGARSVVNLPFSDLPLFKDAVDAFVVMSHRIDEIGPELDAYGIKYYWKELFPSEKDRLSDYAIENSTEILAAGDERLVNAKNLLCDDFSRQVFEQRLKMQRSASPSDKLKIQKEIYSYYVNSYFPDDIFPPLTNKEIYIDAGTCLGNEIIDFMKLVDNKYSHIYSFEPDEINFERLKKMFSGFDRVTVLNKGLYSESDCLEFVKRGFSDSFLVGCRNESCDADETEHVNVVALDEIVAAPVSLIKMDIEGAEIPALIGAENLIKKYHPKLAICVYHNMSDLWKIPELIYKFSPDYRIYLRHVEMNTSGTILYAV